MSNNWYQKNYFWINSASWEYINMSANNGAYLVPVWIPTDCCLSEYQSYSNKSLKPALGSICQLMTRCLSMALCKRTGWESVSNLSYDCVRKLFSGIKNWILCQVQKSHGVKIKKTNQKFGFRMQVSSSLQP